jgi:hypothetical protein|tara:strand:- start:50 stop:265 length:216 start_codon:yes stop_codon:yes gene_type:complete
MILVFNPDKTFNYSINELNTSMIADSGDMIVVDSDREPNKVDFNTERPILQDDLKTIVWESYTQTPPTPPE